MRDKLTSKQEGYAQDRASGLAQSAAYRNNYDTSSMAVKTVWEEACRLDKNYKVSARIHELQVATEAALAVKRLWTTERLIEAAEQNLELSREDKQMGSANGALEFIGRATGLLDRKHQPGGDAPVTQIVINLAPGVEPPAAQIVESSYRELPKTSPELAEGNAGRRVGDKGAKTKLVADSISDLDSKTLPSPRIDATP